jgi:hypothetical protein
MYWKELNKGQLFSLELFKIPDKIWIKNWGSSRIWNSIEFGGIWVKFSRIDGIWLRGSWLHLDDTSTQERKFGISNLWVFSICLKNLIQTILNFDFGLLRNEINQWIWSLIKTLMKVISETITRGVTKLPVNSREIGILGLHLNLLDLNISLQCNSIH